MFLYYYLELGDQTLGEYVTLESGEISTISSIPPDITPIPVEHKSYESNFFLTPTPEVSNEVILTTQPLVFSTTDAFSTISTTSKAILEFNGTNQGPVSIFEL